jgi:DNA polymerase III alpha subunit
VVWVGLKSLIGLFGRGNVYAATALQRDQEDDNDMLASLADAFHVPLVATGGVKYSTADERPLFDVLTSIREHTPRHAPAVGCPRTRSGI